MAYRLKSSFFISAPLAVALLSAPVPALAGGFTPLGHGQWVATAQKLIAAANESVDAMKAACATVSRLGGGDEIRHEYFQVPKWAVMAHWQSCMAYKTVVDHGKNIWVTGDACQNLKLAVRELDKAKAGEDPDDVVALASKLRDTLVSLGGDLKDARTCTFGTGKAR